MKRWMILVLLAATGCAVSMGMDRGHVEPLAEGQAPVIDDARIAAELQRRPQLGEHVRVGVYFLPPMGTEGEEEPSWRWDPEERQQIVEAAENIERFELFPIADRLVTGRDLVSLRLAGAQTGADAILVVDGRAEQRSRSNGWAATYPLILPIFFAPAGELETNFRSEATLYDVRNGFLYATAEAEAEGLQRRAHLWLNRERGLEETRREVMEQLRSELTRRLQSLAGGSSTETSSNVRQEAPDQTDRAPQTDDAESTDPASNGAPDPMNEAETS